MTYSVRRLGCAAWAGPGLNLSEARKEQRNADRTCFPGHLIIPDEDDTESE